MSKEENANYNEEEYHFAVDPDDFEKVQDFSAESQSESIKQKFDFKKILDISKIQEFLKENIQVRNALIAFFVIFILVLLYELTSSLISKKQGSKVSQTRGQQTKISTFNNTKLQVGQPKFDIQDELSKKTQNLTAELSKIKESNDVLNAKISTINSENLKITSDFQELADKLNKLSMQIEKLSAIVEEQSQSIVSLSIKREYRPQPRKQIIKQPVMKYFVKAVIPGRAWLIAENGSTLTVRKGSIVPGYGVVTMVDVSQGRVLTNSGKTITFGQNDS